MSGKHGPLEQFKIHDVIPFDIFGFDISVTNSTLFMFAVILVGIMLFIPIISGMRLVPSRFQILGESIYDFIADMLNENIGEEAKKFIPFVFSIFIYVLLANLLGMLPYAFTVTSHIAVTFALALIVFFTVIIGGFAYHGLHFLSIFAPSGTPLWLMPLMIIIELFTFLARPFTLSIRLAGNMMSGHILMKVLASFVIGMGIYWGWVPIPIMVLMSGFEIFVAILQAYIFTILTCVYLNTAINLH